MLKFLIIFLLFSILPSNQIDNSNTNYSHKLVKQELTSESLLENEKCVCLANKILDSINTIQNSRSVVNIGANNYGGLFISSDNTLHINRTRNEGISYKEFISALNDENVKISIDYVDYSLDEILNVKSYIDKYLYDYVDSVSVKQSDNTIKVDLNDSITEEEFRELLNDYIAYNDSILSFHNSDLKPTAMNSIKAGEKISYKTGWWIFSTEHWYGTVGFNAVDAQGNKGVVTNYHVAPPGYEMRNNSNTLIGYGSSGVLNDTVDAAFVPFEEQNEWELTKYINSSDPVFYISRTFEAIEGAKVWLVGATTGSSYGNITSTYSSQTVAYNGFNKYLTDLIESDADIAGGDSGGPLITWTDRKSNQGIYGINFAGNNEYAYKIKINNVLDDLKVTMF